MKLIAAVAQTATVLFDTAATVAKAESLMAEAAARGARVLVFPEAFIGGYPKGADFHIFIGARTPEGRQDFKKYYDAAVTLDGPEIAQLAQAAGQHQLHVCIGIIERDGGTLYCTALYFSGAQGLIGKHRKLMPTAGERLIWGFGDGSTMEAVDTPYGRVGAVICWENYMPMLRMHMYSQGVTLYCAPTADDRDSWLPSMRHIALEGRCYVLTSCQFLQREAYPEDFECSLGNDPQTVLLRGGSAIVDPTGAVLAGPNFESEAILYADIDPIQVVRGKFDFDASGHYSRPDIFQLKVDIGAKKAVSTVGGAPD